MQTKINVIPNSILGGPPAAGKGEHAKMIYRLMPGDVQILEMGEAVRAEIESGTPLGLKIKDDSDKGTLVSDDDIFQIFDQYKLTQPTILDGFPRTTGQVAEYLRRIEDLKHHGYYFSQVVFQIDAHKDTLMERMNIRVQAMQAAGKTIRKDDKPEILEHRINQYMANAPHIRDAFNKAGIDVVVLNGEVDLFHPIKEQADKNQRARNRQIADAMVHVHDRAVQMAVLGNER